MAEKTTMKPIALALGAAFASSLATTTPLNAAENPFAMTPLSSGYMVAGMEGKCGEGKCGGVKKSSEGKCGEGMAKAKDGMCGEGKCGSAMMDSNGDGKVSSAEFMAHHEKMFSMMDTNGDGALSADEMGGMKGKEGSCGGSMKSGEGKCGGMKKDMEGKCGAK